MALTRVDTGLQSFPDFNRNQQLANAQIYIGVPGLDPAVLANQYQAYVVQENGTQVAVPQPIRTSAGGVPTYLGSPAQIGINEIAYSFKVLSSTGSQIYYISDSSDMAAFATNASAVAFDPSGAGAVSTTVEDILRAQLMVDYAALRAYTGLAKTVRITGLLATAQPQGIAGFFQYDETDVTSADNGGTIIVGADGRRWKRVYSGAVNVAWFGAKGDGSTNDTTAIQAALNVVNDCFFPKGNYVVSSTLVITGNNKRLFSDAGTSRADRTTGARCRIFTSGTNGVEINGTGITIEGIYIESSTTRVQGDGSVGVRVGIPGDLSSLSADFKFVNSVSYGFDIGIGLYGLGYGIKIDNSYILQFKTVGVTTNDSVTVVSMYHPVIETNAAVGTLGILHQASQLTLYSPTIQNCRRGMQIKSGWVQVDNPWFEGCREFDVLVSSGDKPHVVLNGGRYAHPNTGTATTACVAALDVDALVTVNDPIMYVYNGNTIGAFGQFASGGKAVINRLDILDAFTSGATAGNGVYTTNAPAYFSLMRNRNIDGYIFGTGHKLHLKEYATTTTTVKAVDAAGGLGAELLTTDSFLVRQGITYRWNGAAWI